MTKGRRCDSISTPYFFAKKDSRFGNAPQIAPCKFF